MIAEQFPIFSAKFDDFLPAMIGPTDNQTIAIKEVVWGNLLQITFLSDHVWPNL